MRRLGRVTAICLALSSAFATEALADPKIGMSYPATGPQAYLGESWANGAEQAVREINEQGGIKGEPVAFVREDDQGDARQGTLVAQRLCDDTDILAVIANFSSSVTLPTSDVYNQCGVAQITNASNLRITQNGYENLFRPIGNDAMQGSAPAVYAAQTLGTKTAAVLHDKSAYGQGIADIFAAELVKQGGTITSIQGVTATDVDFTPVLAKIRTEKPEAIFFGGMMPAAALIVKQMRSLGMDAVYLTGDPAYVAEFGEIAAAAGEGTIVSTQAPPYVASSGLKKFADDYEAMWGSEPGPYSVYGYNMARIILEAMKRVDELTRESLIAELRNTKFDSLVGPIEFTDTGELKAAQMFLYKYDGGEFQLASPQP